MDKQPIGRIKDHVHHLIHKDQPTAITVHGKVAAVVLPVRFLKGGASPELYAELLCLGITCE